MGWLFKRRRPRTSEHRDEDPLSGYFWRYYGTDRRGIHLRFDATNKCNLRCVMCHFALPETQRTPRQEWSREFLERVEREVFPVTDNVCISQGTEPMMWKGFPVLLDAVGRSGIRHAEMITNATLLTPELARRIVAAGWARVQVSLDGATAPTFESVRVGASFERVIANVRQLAAAKQAAGSPLPELQINVVMLRRNLSELPALVRLAHELGARWLSLRHVVMFDGLDMEQESLVHERERSNRVLREVIDLAAELGVGIRERPDFFGAEEVA